MLRSAFARISALPISRRTAAVTLSRRFATHHLSSLEALQKLASDKPKSLIVVEYKSSTCGKCKILVPEIEALDQAYQSPESESEEVEFVLLDSDQLSAEDKEAADVRGLPTVHFIKDGTLVDSFVGPKINQLKKLVKTHAVPKQQN